MTYIPSADDLEVITREVWSSFLDGDPAGLVVQDSDGATDDKVTGCVHLSGAYIGAIMLQCSPPAARDAAAALFSVSPDDVTQAEVVDAMGEIANMVGGNVKSMLPGPSMLSLPSVIQGRLSLPGSQVVREVTLAWRTQPLTVSLWRQAS